MTLSFARKLRQGARSAVEAATASMASRVLIILVLGMTLAAMAAFVAAGWWTDHLLSVDRFERLAVNVEQYLIRGDDAPIGGDNSPDAMRFYDQGTLGIQVVPALIPNRGLDRTLSRALAGQLGAGYGVSAYRLESRQCPASTTAFPAIRASGDPECWVVQLRSQRQTMHLLLGVPPVYRVRNTLPSTLFLFMVSVGALVIWIMVVRLARAPLLHISRSTQALSHAANMGPLPVSGPLELREAILAINQMQSSIQSHHRERTTLLASISHDLRTPLTRLRLYAEQVRDASLRDKLITSLNLMQRLVEQGLELAQSGSASSMHVMVDLDSLLRSIVEDYVDDGRIVDLDSQCHVTIVTAPLVLRRCIENLVDNALLHAGDAQLSSSIDGDMLHIVVTDNGPGIPPELLDNILQPFARGPDATGRPGHGLGLAIANRLAEAAGGHLTLGLRPTGSLIATVRFPIADFSAPEDMG